MKLLKLAFFGFALVFLGAKTASAHEAYVLTPAEFSHGLSQTSLDAFNALAKPDNLRIFLEIALGIVIAFALNLFFRRSAWGRKVSEAFEKMKGYGPLIVRIAIAVSLLFSALSYSFLGPELQLQSMPLAQILRIALFIISALFLFGVFTEAAAVAALIIFGLGAYTFHWYILTYLNYFGEIVVLILFGSRHWSLDKLMLGPLRRFPKLRGFESSIVRVCYGIALAYAAVTIKLLHPILTVTVVEKYNLTQFHWLFPSDPLLVTLGAALAELAIGIFIALGFELRLTVLISIFYITLSLIYFREIVWPHLLLYGISFNLLFQPEKFTLDDLLFREKKKNASPPTGEKSVL